MHDLLFLSLKKSPVTDDTIFVEASVYLNSHTDGSFVGAMRYKSDLRGHNWGTQIIHIGHICVRVAWHDGMTRMVPRKVAIHIVQCCIFMSFCVIIFIF